MMSERYVFIIIIGVFKYIKYMIFVNYSYYIHSSCTHHVCRMDAVSEALCKEVCLEYTRSHNKILFDKTVTGQPDVFPYVTLPDPEPEIVPQTGKLRFCVCMCVCVHTCMCVCVSVEGYLDHVCIGICV